MFWAVIPVHAQEDLKLEIVYPEKHANINAYSTFFVGNTTPGARLRINNERVNVYPNGGFVHVIDLNPGTNVVNVQTTLGEMTKKSAYTLYTPEYEKTLPEYPLLINKESVIPNESIIYKEGDLIQVSFKGSTGHKAYFSIGKKRKNIPMIEQPPKYIKTKPVYGKSSISSYSPVKGIYKGSYRIKPKDVFNSDPLVIKLVSERKTVSYEVPITISTIPLDNPPIIASIITDYSVIRTSPNKSRLTPLSSMPGIKTNYYIFQRIVRINFRRLPKFKNQGIIIFIIILISPKLPGISLNIYFYGILGFLRPFHFFYEFVFIFIRKQVYIRLNSK